MTAHEIDRLPGYRRRFIVTPGPGWVQTELEDDYHCMAVTIRHENGIATAIEPVMSRAPWSPCPGAVAELDRTFTNVAIDKFEVRGEKASNCTHLHDLAVLAARHAHDEAQVVYDLLVSDPVDGKVHAVLRRDGVNVMSWIHVNFCIVEPGSMAGMSLHKMRTWMESLTPERQEYARMLRWGAMIAHGRVVPMQDQSDATQMQASCYTFQPHRIGEAERVGKVRDFSNGTAELLDSRESAYRER